MEIAEWVETAKHKEIAEWVETAKLEEFNKNRIMGFVKM